MQTIMLECICVFHFRTTAAPSGLPIQHERREELDMSEADTDTSGGKTQWDNVIGKGERERERVRD